MKPDFSKVIEEYEILLEERKKAYQWDTQSLHDLSAPLKDDEEFRNKDYKDISEEIEEVSESLRIHADSISNLSGIIKQLKKASE